MGAAPPPRILMSYLFGPRAGLPQEIEPLWERAPRGSGALAANLDELPVRPEGGPPTGASLPQDGESSGAMPVSLIFSTSHSMEYLQ